MGFLQFHFEICFLKNHGQIKRDRTNLFYFIPGLIAIINVEKVTSGHSYEHIINQNSL